MAVVVVAVVVVVVVVVVAAVVVHPHPGPPHVGVQSDVGQPRHQDGHQHHHHAEDDGVVVVGHAVPDALQTLVVERVVAHAGKVEGDEEEADEEEAEAHGQAGPEGEEAVVEALVADEGRSGCS